MAHLNGRCDEMAHFHPGRCLSLPKSSETMRSQNLEKDLPTWKISGCFQK